MDLIATGEPLVAPDEIQVRVGIDLQSGTLTLTRNREDFAAYHALVLFASVDGDPWAAQEVKWPSDSWFTVTVSLRWHRGEWKMISTEQTNGPTPDEAQPGDFGQAPPL
ncbi:hypothetical protein ABT001_30675 [Streptomyces sp. NPDC002793]|uniref:hypothetical protein n=1 Tax=Streptomyces sp. NPDC002793 TaxID=3154432 RepID=UPI0033212AA0